MLKLDPTLNYKKLFEESMEEISQSIGLAVILDMMPAAQTIKDKIDTVNIIRIQKIHKPKIL